MDGNAGSGAQQFVIWNTRSGKAECQLTIPANREIKTFAVNRDLSRVALASGGDVFVHDTARDVEQHLLRGRAGSIETVCFSADDTRIAAMSINLNSIDESADVANVRSNTGPQGRSKGLGCDHRTGTSLARGQLGIQLR